MSGRTGGPPSHGPKCVNNPAQLLVEILVKVVVQIPGSLQVGSRFGTTWKATSHSTANSSPNSEQKSDPTSAALLQIDLGKVWSELLSDLGHIRGRILGRIVTGAQHLLEIVRPPNTSDPKSDPEPTQKVLPTCVFGAFALTYGSLWSLFSTLSG